MKGKNQINKNILVMLVVTILFLSILTTGITAKPSFNNNKNVQQMLKNKTNKLLFDMTRILFKGLFNSYLLTNCNGVEKITTITFGSTTPIDVDNNPETGENGTDIKVKYYLTPFFEFTSDLIIGLNFTLIIYTLDDGIKNSDFEASLGIGDDMIILGYRSPSETGNEVPGYLTFSFKISLYLFQRTYGFTLNMDPLYDSGNQNKKIELFARFNSDTIQHRFSIKFDPAIVTEISFISSKKQGVWNYDFSRTSSEESKVTSTFINTENGEEKEIIVTIDKLPTDLEFSLGLTPLINGGGQFLYQSNQMYNIELQVQSDELGICKYSTIKNTPKKIFAEWTPTLGNGKYHIEINSSGTDFILKDKIDNPYINFEVNGLKTINIDSYWNLTNPGDFTVYKNNDINIALDFQIGEWIARLNAKPDAEYVSTTWLIATTGYLTIDTNWDPFTNIDLLVKGPNMGLETIGEGYKAQDFKINWTLWPPQEWDLTTQGQIDCISLSIEIYLFNEWRHLWPW